MFQSIEFYKPEYRKVIERYQALYRANTVGHLLVYAMPPFTPPEPLPALNTLNLEGNLEDYLDLTLRNYRSQLEFTREIPDDLLPSMGLFFGIGDYSAFIAGEVVFTEDTSWAAPVIEKWADLDHLTLDENNKWYRLLERAILHLKMRTKNAPIPLVRGYYSPLDMAHALRGKALFTDFYEAPDQVHKLMDFATRAIIWIATRQKALIGDTWDGSIAGAWLPAGSICMSEDIACMVSPKTYARFARPYTQRVIDAFGHGQIHSHSLGLKVIPEITALENLVGQQISDDPNTPRAFDQLEMLIPQVHGVPLTVGCTFEEVKRDIEKLKVLGNLVLAGFVSSVEEGRELIAFARSHSLIQ
jgi:hypothetical protein